VAAFGSVDRRGHELRWQHGKGTYMNASLIVVLALVVVVLAAGIGTIVSVLRRVRRRVAS
jgi:hypothetical protein